MAEANVNISITSSGSSQAAAALNEAAGGLANISKQHVIMADHFQERVQHIGLKLFAADALRSIGLGGEARMMLNLLSSGLTGVTTVAGIGSSGILLLVTALFTLGETVLRVANHEKTLADSLTKTTKENKEHLDSINTSVGIIQIYEKEVGVATGVIGEYTKAQKEAKKAIIEVSVATQQQVVDSINKQIAAINEKNIADKKASEEISKMTANTYQLKSAQMSTNWQGPNAATRKNLEDLNKSLVQQGALLNALQHGFSSVDEMLKKYADDAKKAADEQAAAAAKQTEADTRYFSHWTTGATKQVAEHLKIQKQMKDSAVNTANQINMAQSKAFADALVDGTSFKDAFANIWKDIAKQVIAEIERIIVKLIALAVIEDATGMGAIAGPSAQTLSFLGHASGTSQLVTSPKLFLAGEAGPEYVSITPPGSAMASGSGGGGGASFGNIYITVQGVTDPDAIADTIGQRIIENIRGRGQTDFLRA